MRDESLSPGHAAHLGNKVPAKRRQKEFVTVASPIHQWPTGGFPPSSGPSAKMKDKGKKGESARANLTDDPAEAWFKGQKRLFRAEKSRSEMQAFWPHRCLNAPVKRCFALFAAEQLVKRLVVHHRP